MDFLQAAISFFLHLDQHLTALASQYGSWLYGILWLIIFCETGLVVTPFLPGDSLLFAAGSLAAIGEINIHLLFLLLTFAAILGNTVNYAVGRYLGEQAFSPDARFLKQQYLDRTHRFFERHGGKTIIITRFVPIVRTFNLPFVKQNFSLVIVAIIILSLMPGIIEYWRHRRSSVEVSENP
jgi:membrane-associated protein